MKLARLFVSLCAAVFISLVVFFVSNDYGITWDEPIHFRNGDQYAAWLAQPIFGDKDKFFRVTTEDVHPPFRKLMAGLTHNLQILDNTRGYRISALLFVFPFITLFTYVAIGQFGFTIGILVPLMFSFLPHVLYLTPLVTMDYAIAALWFIAVITAVKGMKNYFWLTVSGIATGLTLLTKLHGYLLFVPLFVIWIMYSKQLARLAYLVGIAIATYVAGWPWLWTEPFAHLREYFQIQTAHGSVPVLLLGSIYEFAPWWYTPLMFLATTPALILVLSFIGALRADKLLLFNALYPIVFFSLPGVYRYDWVRLFLPAFPFVALLAGKGISLLSKNLRIAVYLLWCATLFYSVIRIHPWESSYYNELVGGIAGANRLGFETEYWGNAYLGVLPWMNDHKERPMCVWPTTHPLYYYEAMGQIESGVSFTNTKETCDYLIVLMRQGLFIRDQFVESVVETQTPIYTVSVDGVTLVGVYEI